MDSIPWEKVLHNVAEKKLSKWEQYEENLFSFKLPSEKFLAIGKNRTACLIKSHADDGAAFSLTISQAFSKWINMFCQVIALWVEKNGE